MKSSTRSSASKVSESSNALQENAEKTFENETKESRIESEAKPIGKSIFGNIYNQFKGKG